MDMAAIERLVETTDLKTTRLRAALAREQAPLLFYDRESDELLLQIVPPAALTVVHYIDDHVGFLYEAESLEIVGFQVEAFQTSFLPEHAELRRVWRLSESGVSLEDIEDLIVVFEQAKQSMAREIINYTEPWLQRLFDSGRDS